MTPIWPPTYSSYDRCRSQMTRLLSRPPDIDLRFPENHTISTTECALATGGYFAITQNYGASWRTLESLVTHIEAHAVLDLATIDELGSALPQEPKTGSCSSSMVWSHAREAFSTWWTLSSYLYRDTCVLRPRSASENPSDYFSEIMNEPLKGPLIDHDYRRAWKMWCRVVKTCSTHNYQERENLSNTMKSVHVAWQSALASMDQTDGSNTIAPGASTVCRHGVESLRLEGMRLHEQFRSLSKITAHAKIAVLNPDAALEQGAWPAMLKVMENQSRKDQARLSGSTPEDPMLLSDCAPQESC